MPGIDVQMLMRQARKMEKAMADAKEKLGDLSVDAESAGGLIKVKMNGRCEVQRLEIDPKAIDPKEKPMLEDMIAAAINAGVEKARAAAEASMQQATGGIKIPGVNI